MTNVQIEAALAFAEQFAAAVEQMAQERRDMLDNGWDGTSEVHNYYFDYGGKTPEELYGPLPDPLPKVDNPYDSNQGKDDLVVDESGVAEFQASVLADNGHPSNWASWEYLSDVEQAQLLESLGLVGVAGA